MEQGSVSLPEGYSVEQPQQPSEPQAPSTLPQGYSIEQGQPQAQPQADDEWFHGFGNATPEQIATMKAQNPPMHQLGQGALGFAKSAGQTVKTLVDLPDLIAGTKKPDRIDAALTPTNDDQQAGGAMESIIEFALGDEALKGLSLAGRLAESAKVAKVMERYPRIANILGSTLRGGAVGGAVGGIHGGVEGAEQGAEGGALVGGGLSALGEAASGLKSARQVLFPGAQAEEQAVKDVIGKVLGSKADADVVQEAYSRMNPQKIFSTTENELKLVKPKVDADVQTLTTQLDEVLKSNPWGQVLDAKAELGKVFDNLITDAKGGVGDAKETENAVNAVRARILPKVTDEATPATAINNVKRMVGEQIKNFQPPEMLNSAGKAEQEAYRQAYFRLRDMVSEAVPESKDVNMKLSRAYSLQDLLEKKFRGLDTPEQARNSYASMRSKNAKGAVKSAAKAVGIGGAIGGLGLEAAKILKGK